MLDLLSGGRFGRPFIVILIVIGIVGLIMFGAARFHTEVVGQETFAARVPVDKVATFLQSDCDHWQGTWVGIPSSRAIQSVSIFESCDATGTPLYSQQCVFFDGQFVFGEDGSGRCSLDVSAAVRAHQT